MFLLPQLIITFIENEVIHFFAYHGDENEKRSQN